MNKATTAGFAGEATRLMRARMTPVVWAALALLSVVAVLIGLVPMGGRDRNIAAAGVALLLWLLSLWISAVMIRFMAAYRPRRWAIDGAFFAFLGSQLLVTLFTAALFFGVRRYTLLESTQTSFAVNFAAQIVISLAILPFAPWFAALAVGDPIGVGASLDRMRGAWLPLAGATLLLVLPVQLLHSLLATTAAKMAPIPARAALGVADGLVSALLLALPCALFVAAWRYIRGEAEHVVHDDEIA